MDVAIDKTTLGEVSRKQRGERRVRTEGEKDINVMEQSTAWPKSMCMRLPITGRCVHARPVRMSTISQDAFMHWKINVHTAGALVSSMHTAVVLLV